MIQDTSKLDDSSADNLSNVLSECSLEGNSIAVIDNWLRECLLTSGSPNKWINKFKDVFIKYSDDINLLAQTLRETLHSGFAVDARSISVHLGIHALLFVSSTVEDIKSIENLEKTVSLVQENKKSRFSSFSALAHVCHILPDKQISKLLDAISARPASTSQFILLGVILNSLEEPSKCILSNKDLYQKTIKVLVSEWFFSRAAVVLESSMGSFIANFMGILLSKKWLSFDLDVVPGLQKLLVRSSMVGLSLLSKFSEIDIFSDSSNPIAVAVVGCLLSPEREDLRRKAQKIISSTTSPFGIPVYLTILGKIYSGRVPAVRKTAAECLYCIVSNRGSEHHKELDSKILADFSKSSEFSKTIESIEAMLKKETHEEPAYYLACSLTTLGAESKLLPLISTSKAQLRISIIAGLMTRSDVENFHDSMFSIQKDSSPLEQCLCIMAKPLINATATNICSVILRPNSLVDVLEKFSAIPIGVYIVRLLSNSLVRVHLIKYWSNLVLPVMQKSSTAASDIIRLIPSVTFTDGLLTTLTDAILMVDKSTIKTCKIIDLLLALNVSPIERIYSMRLANFSFFHSYWCNIKPAVLNDSKAAYKEYLSISDEDKDVSSYPRHEPTVRDKCLQTYTFLGNEIFSELCLVLELASSIPKSDINLFKQQFGSLNGNVILPKIEKATLVKPLDKKSVPSASALKSVLSEASLQNISKILTDLARLAIDVASLKRIDLVDEDLFKRASILAFKICFSEEWASQNLVKILYGLAAFAKESISSSEVCALVSTNLLLIGKYELIDPDWIINKNWIESLSRISFKDRECQNPASLCPFIVALMLSPLSNSDFSLSNANKDAALENIEAAALSKIVKRNLVAYMTVNLHLYTANSDLILRMFQSLLSVDEDDWKLAVELLHLVFSKTENSVDFPEDLAIEALKKSKSCLFVTHTIADIPWDFKNRMGRGLILWLWITTFSETQKYSHLDEIISVTPKDVETIQSLVEIVCEPELPFISCQNGSKALSSIFDDDKNLLSQFVSIANITYSRLLREKQPKVLQVRAESKDLTLEQRIRLGQSLQYICSTMQSLEDSVIAESLISFLCEAMTDPESRVYSSFFEAAKSAVSVIVKSSIKCNGDQLMIRINASLDSFLQKCRAIKDHEIADRSSISIVLLLATLAESLEENDPKRSSVLQLLSSSLGTPSEHVQLVAAQAMCKLYRKRPFDEGTASLPTSKLNALNDLNLSVCSQSENLNNTSDYAIEGYLESIINSGDKSNVAFLRGQAYGLAAVTSAIGTSSLRKHDVIARLIQVHRVPGNFRRKQGSLFALELVSRFFGPLFEPHLLAIPKGEVSPLLMILLDLYVEGRVEVKEALDDTLLAILSCVSATGARIIIPMLVNLLNGRVDGYDDDFLLKKSQPNQNIDSTSKGRNTMLPWRVRVAAISWLGSLAGKSIFITVQLPTVLPVLIEGLSDGKVEVVQVARDAIHTFTQSIRSPEIRALSTYLLAALADPPSHTEKCLDAVLRTAFAHVVDAPSLALLQPVLLRALSVGGTEVKRKAAQIVGNLALHLVDAADLQHTILDSIVPRLVECLSDPVPEVRANCGRVLGILVRTMRISAASFNENSINQLAIDLVTSLYSVIVGNTGTTVDRSGAAQALSEVFAAQGVEETIASLNTSVPEHLLRGSSGAREGILLLLSYVPSAFSEGSIFFKEQDSSQRNQSDAQEEDDLAALYNGALRNLIPTALTMLADDSEPVRNAASKACHNVIARLARIDLLAIFDVLLESLTDTRWRCRLGCLQLFQEFLTQFSSDKDSSSANLDPNEAVFRAPSIEELIACGIDLPRVHLLMSRCFIYRHDPSSASIRHLSLAIWKGLAIHPVRSVLSILPVLIQEASSLSQESIGEGSLECVVVRASFEDALGKVGDRIIESMLRTIEDQQATEASKGGFGALYVAMVTARFLAPSIGIPCVPQFVSILQGSLFTESEAVLRQSTALFAIIHDVYEAPGLIGPGKKQKSVVESILKPLMTEILSDEDLDPIAIDALRALLCTGIKSVLAVVVQEYLSYINSIGSVKQSNLDLNNTVDEKCKESHHGIESSLNKLPLSCRTVICTVFDNAPAEESARYVVPTIKALFALGTQYLIEDEILFSLLSALESDEDSPYQVSLSQLIETYYSDPVFAHLAFRLIRIVCTVPNASSLERFTEVWPSRLIKATIYPVNQTSDLTRNGESALIALCEAMPSHLSISKSLAQTLESSMMCENKELCVRSKDLVASLIKTQITPLLGDQSLSIMERTECGFNLAVALISRTEPVSWALSSVTSLVGILIRLASDGSRRHYRTESFTVIYLSLITKVLNGLGILLKPFFPQLQRLLVNALSFEFSALKATEGLIILLPLLSRSPEMLITEWCNMIINSSISIPENPDSSLNSSKDENPTGNAAEFMIVAIFNILCGVFPKLYLDSDRLLAVSRCGMASTSASIRTATSNYINKTISTPPSQHDYTPILRSLESLLSLQ